MNRISHPGSFEIRQTICYKRRIGKRYSRGLGIYSIDPPDATAAHIAKDLTEEAQWHWQIESYLDRLTDWLLQDASFETLDQRNRHQEWLISQAAQLIDKRPGEVMLRSMSTAVSLEGRHGSLNLAIELADPIKEHREAILERNPYSAQAAGDLSVSQNQLGDFHLRRGQPGDAERALGYFEASLKIDEELHRRNPDSPQAARDLSVSQNKLGNFYLQRGQVGDTERAKDYYEAALKISESRYRLNPDNGQATSDLSYMKKNLLTCNSTNPGSCVMNKIVNALRSDFFAKRYSLIAISIHDCLFLHSLLRPCCPIET